MRDGGLQRLLVLGAIEPQGRDSDDVDIEALEGDSGSTGDALEALADDVPGVLGGIEQHSTRLPGREAPQARRPGSDGDGEIEREERLSALGLTADDANGLCAPQP